MSEQGTVLRVGADECFVRWDGALPDPEMWSMNYQLAPLTDPKADAFIESIKKLAREPINTVAKEKA